MLTNADTSALALYRGKKLTPSQHLARLRLHVTKIFGYGSLSRSIVDDNKLDPHKIAAEMGCIAVEGTLQWGFLPSKITPKLQFGEKPDKKTMRKMVKEEKTKQNA